MATAAVPEKVVDQVQDVLTSTKPVNQRLDKVLAILQKHGLAHSQILKPKEVLCHPDNRGGAMVAFHDAWAKGHHMLSVGVQSHLLHGAVCFQLSTQESIRSYQLKKNQDLIQESEGHLAPMTGEESYSLLKR